MIHGSRRSQPPAFTPRILPSPQSRADVEEAVRARRRRRRSIVAAKAPGRHCMAEDARHYLIIEMCYTDMKKTNWDHQHHGHGNFKKHYAANVTRKMFPGI